MELATPATDSSSLTPQPMETTPPSQTPVGSKKGSPTSGPAPSTIMPTKEKHQDSGAVTNGGTMSSSNGFH